MMSWGEFYNRVAIDTRHKAIWIKPNLSHLPLPIQRYDEPFFPLVRSIVQATHQAVGIYVFDLASFLSTGAAGIVALERAIAYTNDKSITVLHGPFTGEAYTVLADDISLTVDSMTVVTNDDLEFYLSNPPYSAFLWDKPLERDGGVMVGNILQLRNSSNHQITLPLYTSTELLSDLSDSFMETLAARIQ